MINMTRNIKSKTAKDRKNESRSLLNPDLDAYHEFSKRFQSGPMADLSYIICKLKTNQVPNASRSLLNPDFDANL